MAVSLLRLTRGFSEELCLLRPRSSHSRVVLACVPAWSQTDGQRRSVPVLVGLRHFQLPNPFRGKQNLRPLDGIRSSNYDLVYRSSMNGYIVYMYGPAIAPAIISVCAVVTALWNNVAPETFVAPDLGARLFDATWQMYAAPPILLAFAAVIWMIADRCILRMYFDEEQHKFIAILGTILPWRVRKVEFDVGQMRHLSADGSTSVVGTFRGEYALGSRRFIIFPQNFKLPYYYNTMVGYK